MSGYVASARIVRASPRLARATATTEPGNSWSGVADEASIIDASAVHAGGPTVAERLDALRERWAQLTFFLFDGESWRR